MYKPTHIGLKNVKATPMTRLAYNKYRGWELPANEQGDDEGYLIEYEPRPGEASNVEGHEGYVSWTPKKVFDDAYYNIRGNLPFGLALELLKQGFAVARSDWSNLKVCMQQPPEGQRMSEAYLYLQYPDRVRAPWVPSQTDMLFLKWHIVD
ncbi:MAG: DUF2829 domain-containing protein [Ignisphaera sp.]|nr:DUF2829 domain-containing protein [Ignisphaera sp.]